MATHFSILAWRIPWMEEPGGLQSIGLQDMTEQLNTHTYINIHNLPSSLLQATILDFASLSSWKFLGLIPLT